MPPPGPDQSNAAAKEQVKNIATRLIGNIDNPAGMDAGQLLDDIGALDEMGRLEAPDAQGVLRPTEPLLFFRDMARARDRRKMIADAFSARSQEHEGNMTAVGKDLRLAWLLGIITKKSYEEGRKKFEVPEPAKPVAAEAASAAVAGPEVRAQRFIDIINASGSIFIRGTQNAEEFTGFIESLELPRGTHLSEVKLQDFRASKSFGFEGIVRTPEGEVGVISRWIPAEDSILEKIVTSAANIKGQPTGLADEIENYLSGDNIRAVISRVLNDRISPSLAVEEFLVGGTGDVGLIIRFNNRKSSLPATAAPARVEKPAGPLTEAPTLLAQDDPFVDLTKEESLRKAEIFWAQNENNLLSHGQTREQVRMDFIAAGRRDLEGITGLVTKVEYRPARHSPRGLGKWVQWLKSYEEAYPVNPGQWVKEPNAGDKLAIKVARQSGQAEGQITSERAVLLRLDREFREDFAVRPAKLRGYGVNEDGRPYLALEWIGDDFKLLESYIEHNTRTGDSKPLPEREAVEIALKLNILLQRFHQADLVHNDIGHILANSFWDPQTRKLRIIDFGNTVDKKNFPLGASFGEDRGKLGELLFRLVTGRSLPNYNQITPADWATMSPATRKVIEKACSLLPTDQSYELFGKETTSEMLTDLNTAFNSLRKER